MNAADRLALAVKRPDIADSTDPQRVARLDPATRDRLAAEDRHAHSRLGPGTGSGGSDPDRPGPGRRGAG